MVNDIEVFFNGVSYDAKILSFKIREFLNQVPIFEARLIDVATNDVNVKASNWFSAKYNSNYIFPKFFVDEVNRETDLYVNIKGTGWVERKLNNFVVDLAGNYVSGSSPLRPQYNSKTPDEIVGWQLGLYSTGVSKGTCLSGANNAINIRGENDKISSFFYGIANVADTDCFASYSSDLSTSSINITSRGMNKSATVIFNISGNNQNIDESSRKIAFEELGNVIFLNGYGDGINQLQSKSFHATSRRNKLKQDLSATGTTASLVSVSGFPNNGSVWIGCEKCNYTGRNTTLNTLTGLTRGVAFQGNVKKAYAHSVNSPVYDGQFTDTSPQSIGTGSSINSNDIKQMSFDAKDIIDQSTLDIVCEKILLERKGIGANYTAPEIVIFKPSDYLYAAENVFVGDTVTVNDLDAGLSGGYRVVEKTTFYGEDGIPFVELVCSNSVLSLLNDIMDDSNKAVILSKYMQGATNIFNIPTYENCDNSKPLNLRFYIPAETVAINSIKLSFKIKPFRAYSSSTAAESTHTHGIPSLTVNQHSHSIPSLTVNSHSHSIPSLSVSGTTTQSSTSNITFAGEYNPSNVASPFGDTGSTTIPIGTSWTPIMQVNVSNIFNDSVETALTFASRDSTSNFLVRVRLFDGSYYYPNSSGTAVQIWSHRHSTTTFESGYGSTYLRLPAQGFYTISGTFTVQAYKSTSAPTVYASGYIGVLKSHKHPIPSLTVNSTSTVSSTSGSSASTTATNTSANASSTTSSNTTTAGSSHVHGVGYAISENSLVNPSVVVTCGPEGSESAVGTYTTDQVNLNITDKITQGTGWYNVKFVPNQNMRIEANVYVQIYINSKVV